MGSTRAQPTELANINTLIDEKNRRGAFRGEGRTRNKAICGAHKHRGLTRRNREHCDILVVS
jgi:hypothetical protein